VVLEVALAIVHMGADAGTQRLDAAAAERNTLREKLAVVDVSALFVKSV